MGLDYNEFVGELGPPDGRNHAELHVRYGKRDDGSYADWVVTLNFRQGARDEFRERGSFLERRPFVRVDVTPDGVRQRVYNPQNPLMAPKSQILTPLQAGDFVTADLAYMRTVQLISEDWIARSTGTGQPVGDPHTSVMFSFMEKEKEAEFRREYDWVRNTLVALDGDDPEMIIEDRASAYFAGVGTTAGVLLPSGRMKFIIIGPGRRPSDRPDIPPPDVELHSGGGTTMGMLADALNAEPDWPDQIIDDETR
ncbi:hypothetical protein [Mycobacteroides abscessus]|uniref:hypothetical protein n=1 Tax=Mycobacteroides abscessus TaxID=36809 RepID=UPI000C256B9D|nr:hypothetical protein [Mycobacteroides abscessus]